MKLRNYMKVVVVVMVMMCIVACGKQPETFVEKETVSGIKIDTYVESVKGLTMGDYKGLKATVSPLPDVTDEDVEAYITSVVDNAPAVNENKSRPVEQGDIVNVDYVGYIDDEEIQDSGEVDYNILIGSQIFFNGAESQLIGAKPGDTVDVKVTFPSGYPRAELIGKNAVYKVTINYIYEEVKAELTDAFVSSISECKTVEEFRLMAREALVASRENERIVAKENAIWAVVLDQVKAVEYDETQLDALVTQYKQYDQSGADAFEMTLEDYVRTYYGMSLEDYDAIVLESAQKELLDQMVSQYIADREGITDENSTDEEIEKGVLKSRVLKYLLEVSEITEK